MRSSFFELNIATSGLFAAQRAMAVTGNNISNAATSGYSRQILEQKASMPLSGSGTGMVGTGVDTLQISRVRDSYIDQKIWGHSDVLGEYSIKVEQNSFIESLFGEPSDVGFTKVYDDFFSAIDDLSKAPGEDARQDTLKQTMISFTQYYNSIAGSLEEYQRDLNSELKTTVDNINMLTQRIQGLNKQITQQEMFGDMANSLRDERDMCVDELSKLINIQAEEVEVTRPDGRVELQFKIKANGQTLVDHFDANLLDIQIRDEAVNKGDVGGLYDIVWDNGLPFDMEDSNLSGELKGIIDMRDGAGGDTSVGYRGIPYYIEKLDKFVTVFAEEMNKVYNQEIGPDGELTQAIGGTVEGVDKDGKATTLNLPKYMLFGATLDNERAPESDITQFLKTDENGNYVDEDGDGFADFDIKATEFSISAEVYESSDNIRTNFTHDTTTGDNPNESNNDMLLALLGQKDNDSMYEEGDPNDFMISMFSEIGISVQEAEMYTEIQGNVLHNLENQRMSVSQVDTNEEYMNLVKYNQAYQVAAKLVTAMDEIYDTMINRLGSQ